MFYTFKYFTIFFPESDFYWEFIYIYPVKDLFFHCTWIISAFILIFCASYNGVCIDTCVHLITVSVLLGLCMLYNIIVGYNSTWHFVLYISCVWFIPLLNHCYKCVCINMFVNIISMATSICFCISYDLLLGRGTFWES